MVLVRGACVTSYLDHVHELDLIRRGHDDDLGKRSQVRQVEAPVVGRAVIADKPGAVEDHSHRQLLNYDVVHDLQPKK